MATEKKGVMVYLPRDVEEVLEKYCTENNITRKNKDGESMPSMGTGIVQYLKSQLLGIAPSDPSTPTLTRDDVLELIKESGTRIAPSTGLSEDEARSIVATAIDEAIAPIQLDLAELLGQVDELRVSIEGKTQASKQGAIEEPKPIAANPADLSAEIRSVVSRLLGNASLRAEVEKLVNVDGLSNKEFVDRLLEAGFGKNNNTEPYQLSEVSRYRRAIAHINGEGS
jgi:hypothetical protein